MKKIFNATVIVIALVTQASPVFAKNPCETVLCMAGMLQGKGTVDGCENAVSDFFDIVVKKNGEFKPDATQDARREFVNQCTTNNGWGDKIADKYGTTRM